MLAGVDPYDDTYFNAHQCVALARELKTVSADQSETELLRTVEAILRLAELLRPAPGRPHHRQLIFVGD